MFDQYNNIVTIKEKDKNKNASSCNPKGTY
jgi:hypothetical protein